MGVRYVLADPPPPSWWAKHKAVVMAVAGLAAGLWLSGSCGHTAPEPGPRPSTPATSPAPHPTPNQAEQHHRK